MLDLVRSVDKQLLKMFHIDSAREGKSSPTGSGEEQAQADNNATIAF